MATVTGTRRLLDISGNNISTAVSLEAEGTLLDSNGQSGTSNQVLISTATGVDWVDGSGSSIIGGPYLPLAGGTMTGVTQFNDHTNYGDQVYARFGASQDLQIFHNGTDSFIDNYTGSLTIRNRQDDGHIVFTCDDGSGGLASYLTLNGNNTHAYFSNPGNVGIGTTSPGAKLEVEGSYGDVIKAVSGSQNITTNFVAPSTGSGINNIISTAGKFNIGTSDAQPFSLLTNSISRIAILSDGKVGIGTTSPSQTLEVAGSVAVTGTNVTVANASNPYIYINDTDAGAGIFQQEGNTTRIGSDSNTQVVLVQNNATAVTIDTNKNVGIGTTSPTADLHIQGSSATDLPILRVGGFGNSGSKLELAETLTSGDMNYGFSFFNDGNGSNTLLIKAHNNSTTGVTAITINRTNSLTTFNTVPVVGTRTAGDNSTRAASTAFVTAAITAAAPTVNNGTLTMTTNTGLDGGATFTANQSGNSAFAVSLDLSELTDMTQTMVGSDEFIVLDNSAERRKAASEIGLSIFDNDAGFTTNIGDITAVVAGTGLTGGGTSGSVTLNVAASTYTPYNDIRSLGVPAFTNGTNPNITTAQVMDEIDSDGGFDSYSSVFKTSWSYAGNYNLTDAGDFTETAGSSWITWTDNSSDSTRGNITTLAIAPNTGGSAGGVFIYNNQGGSYSPGWRQVWTSMTDGAGSGLDADLLDGQQGSYYLDYANFTGTPTIPSVGNGQIDGRTSGLGLSGSMDATANQSGNTTFTVTSNAVTAATASTIAYRTSSADIRARLFRSNYANESNISGGMAFRVNNGADDYIRFCSNAGAIRTFLGVPHSGDLNNYLLNTTDTFTGTLTIDGELELANGPNGIIYTTDDILTLSSGGKTGGTNIAIDDGGSVIKLNSDTIAQGEFKVSSLTDGTGDDVFRALVTSSNSSFSLGDIEGLGDGSYIVSDGTTIKLRNNGGINTLVTDNSNNVEIPNGNLIISNQIGVNTTNFNPQAGIIVNGNQTFGTPGGGANVNSRYLSIEGNADASGEGSGRLFFTEHNSTTAAMDNYGMSLGYRGGATSIVGASGNTWTGLTQIGNGQWGMFGHNNDAAGALIMSGDRAATYVEFHSNDIKGAGDIYVADQIIHTGDTNTYMQFHAADQWRVVTGGSERLEVNNTYTKVNTGNFVVNNNVGVGTTTPTSPIGSTRYINVKSTGNGEIILDHTDAGTASDLGLYSWARNADHLAHIKASCDGSTTAAFISFHTQAAGGSFSNPASNEKMRIRSNGNVGIGTTSPGDKLHVNGTVRSQAPATSDWALLGYNSAGSAASGLWFDNGDGELLLRDDSGNLNVRLRSDTSSYINGGNLGIGTTSPAQKLTVNGRFLSQGTSTPIYIKVSSSYKSWVHHIGGGDEYIFAPSTVDGGETWDWANQVRFNTLGVVQANNFVLASDKRLKKNIKDVSNKRIKANWKTFEMIADETKAQRHGVIAQELEKVHPEFVRTDNDGMKSVAYTDLLIAKIAELEARLEKLEK